MLSGPTSACARAERRSASEVRTGGSAFDLLERGIAGDAPLTRSCQTWSGLGFGLEMHPSGAKPLTEPPREGLLLSVVPTGHIPISCPPSRPGPAANGTDVDASLPFPC